MYSTNDKLPHQIINVRIHYMGESMIGTDQTQHMDNINVWRNEHYTGEALHL